MDADDDVAPGGAGADDEEDGVDAGGEDGGVGDGGGGRGVVDDDIGALGELLHEVLGEVGVEELGGVGRDGAAGEDHEVGDASDVLHGLAEAEGAVEDEVGEADGVGQAEDFVDVGLAQVGVDQDDALAGLGEDDGQVGGGEGLALGRAGAGDEDAADGVVEAGELDVGAEDAEALGLGGLGLLEGDQAAAGQGPGGRGGGRLVALAVAAAAVAVPPRARRPRRWRRRASGGGPPPGTRASGRCSRGSRAGRRGPTPIRRADGEGQAQVGREVMGHASAPAAAWSTTMALGGGALLLGIWVKRQHGVRLGLLEGDELAAELDELVVAGRRRRLGFEGRDLALVGLDRVAQVGQLVLDALSASGRRAGSSAGLGLAALVGVGARGRPLATVAASVCARSGLSIVTVTW